MATAGPQEARLRTALAGADTGTVGDGAVNWESISTLLKDVADALVLAAERDEEIGGQTGPAMGSRMRKAAEDMKHECGLVARGSSSLDRSATLIADAEKALLRLDTDEDTKMLPDPGTYTPPVGTPTEQDLTDQKQHHSKVTAHQENMQAREEAARKWADHMDQVYAHEITVMKSIHGIPDPEDDLGDKTSGPSGSGPGVPGTGTRVSRGPRLSGEPRVDRDPKPPRDDDPPREPVPPRDPLLPDCDLTPVDVDPTVANPAVPQGPTLPTGTPGVPTGAPGVTPATGAPATPVAPAASATGGAGYSPAALAAGAGAGATLGAGARAGVAAASGARPIGASARPSGASGTLGRSAGTAGSPTSRPTTGARGAGGAAGAGRGAAGGRGAGAAGGRGSAGAAGAGSRGGRGTAGAGAGGRRNGKNGDATGRDRDLFDDGSGWIDDEGVAPEVLD